MPKITVSSAQMQKQIIIFELKVNTVAASKNNANNTCDRFAPCLMLRKLEKRKTFLHYMQHKILYLCMYFGLSFNSDKNVHMQVFIYLVSVQNGLAYFIAVCLHIYGPKKETSEF